MGNHTNQKSSCPGPGKLNPDAIGDKDSQQFIIHLARMIAKAHVLGHHQPRSTKLQPSPETYSRSY